MLFQVQHTSRYRYSSPVQLDRHTLRFRPRSDGTIRVRDFRLRVHPRPYSWSECLDLEGNTVVEAGFDGWTDSLTVIAQFSAETTRQNPFDFVLAPWATMLPLYPIEPLARALAPYRFRQQESEVVDQLARSVFTEAGGRTVTFLTMLARRLAETIDPTLRIEGAPQSPETTLLKRSGACRDVAVLFNEACRFVGLAARFVSGYQRPRAETDARYLHAWSEIFLPGAGWRGFDPVTGLAIADDHIAVAAAAIPSAATPIDGSYRTSGVTSALEVQIDLETEPSAVVASSSEAS